MLDKVEKTIYHKMLSPEIEFLCEDIISVPWLFLSIVMIGYLDAL